MSAEKELDFFSVDALWEKGVAWYERQFAPGTIVRGESSPSYSTYPRTRDVPTRMASVVPDARLIYLVRDPIERMLSLYRFARFVLQNETRTLTDAVRDFDTSRYVVGSRYADSSSNTSASTRATESSSSSSPTFATGARKRCGPCSNLSGSTRRSKLPSSRANTTRHRAYARIALDKLRSVYSIALSVRGVRPRCARGCRFLWCGRCCMRRARRRSNSIRACEPSSRRSFARTPNACATSRIAGSRRGASEL
jgi:hypothetical protein